MTREIIEVPFPRASVKPLINCAWGEACERAIASERAVVLGFIEQRRSVSPGQKKERTSRTRERERENEKRPHHLGAFVAKTHHHHRRRRRRTPPTPTTLFFPKERENKKRKNLSRRRTFLIFHISMFSSWSSPMDAIFFALSDDDARCCLSPFGVLFLGKKRRKINDVRRRKSFAFLFFST
jgi:hypothetical protein